MLPHTQILCDHIQNNAILRTEKHASHQLDEVFELTEISSKWELAKCYKMVWDCAFLAASKAKYRHELLSPEMFGYEEVSRFILRTLPLPK